jgi:dsRNA-specific ribonuclease
LKAALYEKNGSKKTKRFVSEHLHQYFKDLDNGIFADNLDFCK